MILETIASFKEELKQLGKWSKDEINQMLDDGIQKYIINYEDKFGKTKTFLFRDQQVDFYKIYFPLSLCTPKNKRAFNVPLVTDSLFDKSHCITILGNAGSGKTMLLKHCFLSTLKHSTQIPIIIELRKLNTYPGTLSEYIQEQFFAHKLVQNGSILDRLLGSGKFTFMFDGFDELSLQSKDQHIRELDAFIDKYNNNYYLLTSRPGANAESLTRFNNYQVCSLTPRQIEKFIHIQLVFSYTITVNFDTSTEVSILFPSNLTQTFFPLLLCTTRRTSPSCLRRIMVLGSIVCTVRSTRLPIKSCSFIFLFFGIYSE